MKIRNRKLFTQGLLLVSFFLVPLLNLFRLDLFYGHFYILGKRFSFNEAIILLLAILLLVLFFIIISKLFHRHFCRWICPHNSFISLLIKLRSIPFFKKKQRLASLVETAITFVFAPIISFSFFSYFINPKEILVTIHSLDFLSIIGSIYVFFTLLFYLLISTFKQRFCKSGCPYGLLQNVFSDQTKTKRLKNYFTGINLILITLFLVITSAFFLLISTGKGYNVSIRTNLSNIAVEEYLLYTFDIEIENVYNETSTYIISYENIPSTWKYDVVEKVIIPKNEHKIVTAFFKVSPDTFLHQHNILIRVQNNDGREIMREIMIYPVPK
ncbi:4Fe-4S binding protein [Anaerobacillus sp. MEB173]|uniref:4Fe-4S binding protein n=1 Tax=Anaerobacillus sp. MEB173 TaxID=3383345 RepID=UPI003F92FAAB